MTNGMVCDAFRADCAVLSISAFFELFGDPKLIFLSLPLYH